MWCSSPCSWQELPCAWPAKFSKNLVGQKEKLLGVWPPAFTLAGVPITCTPLFKLCFSVPSPVTVTCQFGCKTILYEIIHNHPDKQLDVCIFCVFSETVLRRIMHILANAAAYAYTRETCATFIKFSSPETMHVSRHPGLKNASGLVAICT